MISLLIKLERACNYLQTHESADVWLFREFVNGPALSDITTHLTLSSIATKKHEGTVTFYTVVMKQPLGRHAFDAIVAKANEKICIFVEETMTPSDFSQNI